MILREVGEGGTTTYKLCLDTVTLWSRDMDTEPCPTTLEFSLNLPTTFSDGKDTYVSTCMRVPEAAMMLTRVRAAFSRYHPLMASICPVYLASTQPSNIW